MERLLVAAVAAWTCVFGALAYAHHSFAATYIEDKSVTIEGELVQVLFRNPHSFVHVMAPDKDGKMQRWAIEWGGGAALSGQGVTAASLKPGDKVVVRGQPGRNPADHRMRMLKITRPSDGWAWGGNFD
jgi:hypothetical protein